jgi:hypothetical protein
MSRIAFRGRALAAAGVLSLALAVAGSSAQALDLYQNPDGTYPSLANEVRDINGTPCGIECTAEGYHRWGVARQAAEARPHHRDFNAFFDGHR